jgi:hypothetical protein
LETSPVAYTYTELKAGLPLFKSEPNLIIRHAEKISMSKSGWTIFPSLNVRATIMESRASFQRQLYCKSRQTSYI